MDRWRSRRDMNSTLDDPDSRRSYSFLRLGSLTRRSGDRNLLETLGENFIGRAGSIRSAYRTRNRMCHPAIMGFDIKSVTLPASAFDFDRSHSFCL
jgi:hypothetical protein